MLTTMIPGIQNTNKGSPYRNSPKKSETMSEVNRFSPALREKQKRLEQYGYSKR